MATNKYQEQWFSNAPGRATDPDGVAGFQCVDTAKDYFEHIFGLGWKRGWPGAGNAKDMLRTIDPEFFDVIWNDDSKPDLIPQRGDIIVWGGTPAWGVNPYGHIAVCLDADANGCTVIQQDGFLQCPMFTGRLGWNNTGTGPVLGWLRPKFDGTPVAGGPAVAGAVVRKVGERGVNERSEPKVVDGNVTETYTPGSPLNMKGFVHGDPVSGNDVWFVGAIKGRFYHSSGFIDQSTNGLADLTPPKAVALQPFQRITGESGVIRRSAPDKNATVIDTFMPDRILDLGGFIRSNDKGPYGDGNNVWFVGKLSGGYMWSGAFTDSSPNGLADLTASAPTPAPAPAPAAYDFALDFTSLVREDGVIVSVEKTPAASSNVDTGNFPAQPEKVVIHQFGTLGVDTFQSTRNQFAKDGTFVSAHFSVSGRSIRQHVSLHDRAYHAASNGNAWVGIETDPAQDAETLATTRALLLALDQHYGRKLTTIKHRDVPGCSTSCGAVIDLARFDVAWPVVVAPKPTPEPTPAPVPAPEPAPEPLRAIPSDDELEAFLRFLVKLYRESKVNA